ncbi:MAG: bifunctional phosphopantothenoylcysteine decarboxylase/phosphopantothenate--cysteine ligase CoaBC [Pseudomonadota bacterium]
MDNRRDSKCILLIIGGGIAAYKVLEFIRRARDAGFTVRAVMTEAATQFVTPLSVGAITGERVFLNLWDRDDEHDIGHIRLSREADLIVVAPATANLMAHAAHGHANDLATTVLLASDKPILMAPAMNPAMWEHPATARNHTMLDEDGVFFVGPNAGEMAESGEAGVGRMAEPSEILDAAQSVLATTGRAFVVQRALSGRHVLVTAGPTHEPIDPVRYIANRSSGKQGYAIAAAAAAAGARVTLVSGPTALAVPRGVMRIDVETAAEMAAAVDAALPADVAIFTAAVADWRVAKATSQKIKKAPGEAPPDLALAENPDILKSVAGRKRGRPTLVIGFAAETDDVIAHATAKRARKGCDWIVANDVSPKTGVMGGDFNTAHVITATGVETWPELPKDDVAARLVDRIADWSAENTAST